MYMLLKHLHMTFALLTFVSFLVRGIWMLRGSPLLHKRLVKILPHIIDTILLVSALTLAFHLKLTPGNNPWLMTKIVALVFYIVLGVIAFKHSSLKVRTRAWAAGLVVLIYIIGVALTKNPLII